ncbi:MAG: hypothetical protein UU25_C0005G0009 [Microgenomates group bacterium GW2011_GWB1_40_9]|uniref:Phosphodiester glycosidase domain-containing protein n=1 Tax=Candidatus Roizmanbacteria bacterium GW2011_GWC2_41_7 TaxID=1618487 RepID=A0A0G1A551_9BACT|nr:MAG: hypothetical protein UT26_C0020G0003 [Microgenomates group bacterium GW2011_GWC1_39_12]KKR79940.1 MAG: hypothetical protein UU25_C0005G0009 [Microgenomates group bacterium GW2011_GWB1_40_9]KKS20498.1 MAG: hypothetical protein UU78_C0062G0003 [Candidatus Roizmanbacteria bacterium GW2011_GWC2_41_7]
MKKIFSSLAVICLVCIGIFFVITSLLRQNISKTTPSTIFSTPLPTTLVKTSTVTRKDITYGFEYFEVTDISKLTLIENFTQKKSSELLMKENNCQYAINGGFYDIDNKPLGLFINSQLKTKSINSALVNGYVSITNKPIIDFNHSDKSKVALQTGPMLMMDRNKLKLAIANDEYARRMIAGISSNGTLVFMTLFIQETKVQGPKLADLPDILKLTNLDIVSAINLDGGNASMFKNTNIYIPEVSSIGAIFCVNE